MNDNDPVNIIQEAIEKVMDTDPRLGRDIHELLKGQDLETPRSLEHPYRPRCDEIIEESMVEILGAIGLNIYDPSIEGTPRRVAKMFLDEIFSGLDYDNFPNCTSIGNHMQYDELLTTKCSVISMCEHHLVPFQGHAFIGYLPSTKIMGLSKFNRVTDFFSRRPQVQERLTAQIHASLRYILDTEDVAVVLQCEHLCVKMRGVRDHQSTTSTSKMSGRFRTVDALRAEFFSLLHQNRGSP